MDLHRLQEELRRTRRDLLLLYEIGNLIRSTLLFDEVLYLVLSAVTSHQGLGFNRAIVFMVDDGGTQLEGCMAIGPTHPEASPSVWKAIEENKITLEGLLDVYHKSNKRIDPELNRLIQPIRIPIERAFGALASAVIHDRPALVHTADVNHELTDLKLRSLGISQFMVVPLRGKDRVIGVLMVDNVTTRKEMKDADLERLVMLANHAGLAIENAKTYTNAVVSSQQDSLTKLWNHGHFQRMLTDAMGEARRSEEALSLIVFDVDDFKSYNDTYGHPAGDQALEEIARIAKSALRRSDNLARYGGEEFAAVLPGTTKAEAVKMAERLRSMIWQNSERSNTARRRLSVSIGVSTYPDDAEDKDKLIFCADGALYEAKRQGKNQVRAYLRAAAQPLHE
ncbi:MAG: hypothetical protein MOGMAGMI_00817 [Candidatus Omnitrophica bacterium]|nr:hypothetical protein [Candidatus Omnitrophota bacterium]